MKTSKKIYGITLALMCGLAATLKAQNIYVANFTGSIGEYTTSGQTVNASLISGLGYAQGVVISENSLFVTSGGTIGEYTTSGAAVNTSLVYQYDMLQGIAILGNELYVVDSAASRISEYTTSRATINASLIFPAYNPVGIVISGNDLFVACESWYGKAYIGEYTTSGATVNASLISGLSSPENIAIGTVPEPSAIALAGLGAAAFFARCCSHGLRVNGDA
jgi:DNA-binding beta-propeller fold protein YncE